MSDRAYRVLLGLFPRAFRREYGAEMLRLFRERSASLGSRDRRRLRRFRLAALRDLAVHGSLERVVRLRTLLPFLFIPARRHRQPRKKASTGSAFAMSLRQDIRHAVRGLIRRPGFSAVVVLTMAIGIGGNAAIFSALNAVLLRGLPFPDPEQLVTLDVRSYRGFLISTSIPNYTDWQARNRSFSHFGASTGWTMTYTGGSRAQVVSGRLVLGEFFETLGVDAHLGRTINMSETERGGPAIGVLGYRFWQREFGGDSSIINSSMTLDGQTITVIGVMPRTFGYPATTTDVYVPMGLLSQLPWENRNSAFGARSIARLGPGVSMESAAVDMERVGREVRAEFGNTTATPEVKPLSEFYVGQVGPVLWILMGAVAFVLLIAVANVGNLMLVRGEDRKGELAVRAALGASRGTVIRHLVSEGLVLALVGGVAGLLLAYASMPALIAVLPSNSPVALTERIGIDGSVLGFITLLVLASGLAFGVLPSLRVSKRGLLDELRSMSRSTDARSKRLRMAVVVIEVAVATILLVGASLMVETLMKLNAAEKGFQEEDVLTARVRRRFPDSTTWRNFYVDLESRARALPGVRSASVALLLPLADRSWEQSIWPEGVPVEQDNGQSVLFNVVSEAHFETLGVPLVAGRTFTSDDRPGTSPVAIIDETMADLFWPGEDPIGKRVTFEQDPSSTTENPLRLYRTVVGVIRNVRHYELDSPSRIQVYVPFFQMGSRCCIDLYLIAKTSIAATALAAPIQQIAAELDPEAALSDVQPMRTYVDAELSDRRAVSSVLLVFGVVALALAGMGVFGVISYSVSRQTREIGLRLALGARQGDVVRWLAQNGLLIGGIGVLIGLVVAAGLARTLAALLYQVSPIEPLVYVMLAVLITITAGAAAYIPARRAMRVDPVTALKQE